LLSLDIKPLGVTGYASTDYAPELCELEARLQSGDSVTAEHNAHVVLWRIRRTTCSGVLCSLKNAGQLTFQLTTALPRKLLNSGRIASPRKF